MFMSTIKESAALKQRTQVINSMQKREHNQLWLGLQDDKFDQFWDVNKKLMESLEKEPFKHIPFRIYQLHQPFIQRLIKPNQETGQNTTLKDLIKLIFPDSFNDSDECSLRIIIHGIEPPFETPLQWLSEHLSYPDNFLHFCASPKLAHTK